MDAVETPSSPLSYSVLPYIASCHLVDAVEFTNINICKLYLLSVDAVAMSEH